MRALWENCEPSSTSVASRLSAQNKLRNNLSRGLFCLLPSDGEKYAKIARQKFRFCFRFAGMFSSARSAGWKSEHAAIDERKNWLRFERATKDTMLTPPRLRGVFVATDALGYEHSSSTKDRD